MKILVIDDDIDLLKLISNSLKKDYEVTTEIDAEKIDINKIEDYDLILLDVMMPKISGFDFLRQNRGLIDIPILLLTARDFEEDKIEGFAIGADDYITKPFSIGELRARVDAHIRREKREKHRCLVDQKISCDLLSMIFYFDNVPVNLTSSEYKICELLLKNKGQVFSKEKIYTSVYGYDALGDSKTSITERIKKIRNKFEEYGISPIETVWGVGYKWGTKKV
ncbi:DNA-binding response regulator [Floricoccus tropicus]|uniref:DNA-binding response regulator n=1 Tax=Floricoccus tropicus TaxID=1859473 RepID=A0A1E8GMR5_9LACT|nr:response regulator transcription factor [Floricoccus tropicus]OFI48933.1 DNA-binding response regulator [Floricoccus tropicus]